MQRAAQIGVVAVSVASAGRIFLSYRHIDTPHVAGRLFDRLESRFGAGNVFMDVDSIEPGRDFAEAIETAVGQCDVLLALIGRGWVDARDEHGRRRLEDPDDFVALEIGTAFHRGIRVIPILVDGASPPQRDKLPPPLTALARRQAVRVDHATFGASATILLTALERVLRAGTAVRLDADALGASGHATRTDAVDISSSPVTGSTVTYRDLDPLLVEWGVNNLASARAARHCIEGCWQEYASKPNSTFGRSRDAEGRSRIDYFFLLPHQEPPALKRDHGRSRNREQERWSELGTEILREMSGRLAPLGVQRRPGQVRSAQDEFRLFYQRLRELDDGTEVGPLTKRPIAT